MRFWEAVTTCGLVTLALLGCDLWPGPTENRGASDAIAEYDRAKRSGDPMLTCIRAHLVVAALARAKDEGRLPKWQQIERADCATGGAAAK